ncbi:putative oxidoreductase At1g06690, chloroplastic [Colletotrichum liriopes]|uniref:Oxidoreductase At1g06690, chloroplastic n=1 Tax=Colletotrichum liriopes TaxID=708192 RepID=A0AA37GD45_9PEZI|nr:putative oxidoreductase At1g06690, chloroplastic [Colletotrichum liriopes]
MDAALQTALSSGLSAVSGFHSNKPKPVDPELAGKNTLPQSFVPSLQDRISIPSAKGEIKASQICIGGWPWGDKATWHWDESEWIKVQEAWQTLYDSGINFIDTAEAYGNGESETIVGQLARGLPRENVVVQTKYFSTPLKATNFVHPVDSPVISLKGSLGRMGLDYVDIYLVHGPIHPQSLASVAEGMAKCVKEGLTRAVGVANYDNEDVLQFRDELKKYDIPLATNQCEFNILRRYPEVSGNIARCKDAGLIFQSYSSLAQGRLTGKYTAENPPPKEYRFSSYDMKDIEPTITTLREIGEKRGKSIASVALNYNLGKGVLPLVGVRNAEQAKDAIAALGWRLSNDEVFAIDKVSVEGQTTSLWQQG